MGLYIYSTQPSEDDLGETSNESAGVKRRTPEQVLCASGAGSILRMPPRERSGVRRSDNRPYPLQSDLIMEMEKIGVVSNY